MSNDLRLQEGHPVDENLRPIKVGGQATALETAKSGNGARVRGDLEVTGDIKGNVKDMVLEDVTLDSLITNRITSTDLIINDAGSISLDVTSGGSTTGLLFKNAGTLIGDITAHHSATYLRLYENGGASDDDYIDIYCAANGASTIKTTDSAGADANLTLDVDGDISLDAAGGNITLLNNGSTYTPTASSDAVPLSHLPFVLYAQFQDDVGTAKHYLPLKGYFEQALTGNEPAGMIAPFNMKLQKVVMRCSEDISGADWTMGMWAIDSGTTHSHHHTTGINWIQVTGGAADTNAVFDFTGIVGLAASGSGGSNAVTAGQWMDFSIQSDTDVTSSSAEFWITLFFIADLGSTI